MTSPPAPTRRRVLLPVRTRIVAVITLVAALGLAVVGATVYLVERAVSLEAIDGRLHDNLESARVIVEAGAEDAQGQPTGSWTDAEQALRAVVQRMSPDDNTGVIGILNGRPALEPGIPLDLTLTDAPGFVPYVVSRVTGDAPVVGTYAEEGVVWQFLAVPIVVDGATGSDAIFAMAYDVTAELAEINSTAQAYLIAAAAALIVIAVVATVVATRLLRPIRQMRETAERVSAQALSERLPIQGRDDVSELAETMNDMLDRLDDAMDSQRQLLSDVGHEMKTPITIVRGNLEVMDPDDPDDVRATRALVIDELERMDLLVQDLSAAAALHGPRPVVTSRVDAGELLTQIVRKAQAIDGADVSAGPAVDVVTALDPGRITQAMLQLTQNAVTHGGGRIEIGSRVAGDMLELTVRDHGPGVPDAEKSGVFERFRRLSTDRAGSGLGLSIVQVIARAHGGAARVEDAPGGGAIFVVAVPLALTAPPTGSTPTRPLDLTPAPRTEGQ